MNLEEATQQAYKLSKDDADKETKKMLKAFKQTLDNTNAKISSVYTKYLDNIDSNDYLFELSKNNRLSALNKAVDKVIIKSTKAINKAIINSSEVALKKNYQRLQFLSNFFTEDKVFNKLDKGLIKASVLGDSINPRYKEFNASYGKLQDILDKNNAQTLSRVNVTIKNGISQGLSSKEITKNVTKQLNTSANNALRVIRTETQRNLNNASLANNIELKNAGEVVKRQIVSTLDSVTREQSIQVNGQVEDDNGYFTYPNGLLVRNPGNSGVPAYDVNDREQVINIVGNATPTTEVGKNPLTNNKSKISFRNFKSWLKKRNK